MRHITFKLRVVGCICFCAALALSFGSCGTSTNGQNNGGGGSGGGGGGGSGGTSCTTTLNCTGGQVCDPATSQCSETVTCTTHGNCGTAAYCDNDQTCAPSQSGSPCGSDDNCVSDETCGLVGYCGCGGEAFTANAVPPYVVIMLDRSISMIADAKIDGKTKWQIAQEAIGQLLTDYSDTGKIHFGLSLYPGPDLTTCPTDAMPPSTLDCAEAANHFQAYTDPGALLIAPKDGTTASINADLQAAVNCQGTPIANTLMALKSSDPAKQWWDAGRSNYVLLVTDGKENCPENTPERAATAAAALKDLTPSVKTFVIGFSSGVNSAQLDDIAISGGTDSGGTHKYYQANDLTELKAAFNNIGGSVITCTYQLASPPDDQNLLNVRVDGMLVGRDTGRTNGWDYLDTTHIEFFGPPCDTVKSGKTVSFVYGCPTSGEW